MGEGYDKQGREGRWHDGHEAHQVSVCVVLDGYFVRGRMADRLSLPGVELEVVVGSCSGEGGAR